MGAQGSYFSWRLTDFTSISKFRKSGILLAMSLLALNTSQAAGAYDKTSQIAAHWLTQQSQQSGQQDQSDGGWGEADELRPIATAEAVLALRAYNQRTAAYYAGLAWLSNHRALNNVDVAARRVLALSGTGANLSQEIAFLTAALRSGSTANGGWGLSKDHNGSALDTALVLQALRASGQSTDASDAVAFLKSSQLTGTDRGWASGQDSQSDPTSTAHAIVALAPYIPSDNTLATSLGAAATTLASKVTTTSPQHLRALTAMALLTLNPADTRAGTLLDSLKNQLEANGALADAYATALALRAFSMSAGRDLSSQREVIQVTDAELRRAINETLGRDALNQLNRGELAALTSLDISNRRVKNLTGLEAAVNLKNLNLANNPDISDFTPIAALKDTVITCTGDTAGCPSLSTAQNEGDTPIPAWALLLMSGMLLHAMAVRSRSAG